MAPTVFDTPAKPGDLIEIHRGTYEHWAVYIGGHEVVHMIPPCNESGMVGDLLMLLDSGFAEVKRQKLSEVVGTHGFHVNNLLDDEYEPRERAAIVRDACRMVGRLLPYSIVSHNCEHFVTELRYGKPESRQVKTAAMVGAVAAGIGIVALGAAFIAALSSDDDTSRNRSGRGPARRSNWQ